jgi:hypothetical protein
MSRKQQVTYGTMISDQARAMASQAAPMARNAGTVAAQQAVPLARSAGVSMKQGADGAVAWATPYVGAARHWAAPYLEQSAATVTDAIAPKVADALRMAAEKIDYVEPKPRRRFGKATVIAGSMLLAAAGTAAAVSMRNRNGNGAGYSAAAPAVGDTDMASAPGSTGDGHGPDNGGRPDTEVNGHPTIT